MYWVQLFALVVVRLMVSLSPFIIRKIPVVAWVVGEKPKELCFTEKHFSESITKNEGQGSKDMGGLIKRKRCVG